MKSFKEYLEALVPTQDSPQVAAIKSQATMAVTNAVKNGQDPVRAAKEIAAKAVQSGKLQIKDLAKVTPSDSDSNPNTKMMKKK
jgi:peptidoglycan hydrolase-like amidase